MPEREDELPESIVLQVFEGLRNNVAPERLKPGELERALNVDIDDAGQVRRRRGRTLVSSGNYHSLKPHMGEVYGVKNGELGVIAPNYTFSSIVAVGSDPLSYTSVDDTLYFSSRSASGKIRGYTATSWGQTGGAGEWLSPVISPTETMGEVFGQMLNAPPLAEFITYYKGRIYLGSRKWIWGTELYRYDEVDRTRNFVQVTSDLTMLEAVENGIFVGAEDGIRFLSGTLSKGLKHDKISDAVPVRGSVARMPASRVYPQARDSVPAEGNAIVFLTNQGIMAGFDNGQIFNLTYTKMNFPKAVSAAGLYREQDGVNQYAVVTDTAGTPSAQVRIGDYVEAEIRRFQGG